MTTHRYFDADRDSSEPTIRLEPASEGPATVHYTPPDGTTAYPLADIDMAENGFVHLRSLYNIPGMNRADYEIALERAEEAVFDHLDGQTINATASRIKGEDHEDTPPRPADYGLAEKVDAYLTAADESAAT